MKFHRVIVLMSVALSLTLGAQAETGSEAVQAPQLISAVESDPSVRASERRQMPIEVLFQDDFESGMGSWSVTDQSGVAEWGDWDCWSTSGSRSAGCAAAGPGAVACAEDYPTLLKTWMVYGPFTLDFAEDYLWAEMNFEYTIDTEVGFDRLVVAASTDGVRFTGVEYEGVATGSGTLDLTALREEPAVWVGLQFASDHGGGRPIGASIDDVVIRRHRPQPTVAADAYGWSISDRIDDPLSLVGEVPGSSVSTLYLWYVCDKIGAGPASVFEGKLDSVDGLVVSFTPLGGALNAGGNQDLHLAFACRTAPSVVGEIIVLDTGSPGFKLCLDGRATALGEITTVDCGAAPIAHASTFRGYRAGDVGFSCGSDSSCGQDVTTVERAGWSQIKSWYR